MERLQELGIFMYDIRKKLTDKEYKGIMDSLSKIEKTTNTLYKLTFLEFELNRGPEVRGEHEFRVQNKTISRFFQKNMIKNHLGARHGRGDPDGADITGIEDLTRRIGESINLLDDGTCCMRGGHCQQEEEVHTCDCDRLDCNCPQRVETIQICYAKWILIGAEEVKTTIN